MRRVKNLPGIAALRSAVAALSQSLGDGDIAAKWDEELRQTFLSWMRDLLVRAERGEDVGRESKSIIRNLDVAAIHDGRLHDVVLGVQRAWREAK